MFGSHLRFDIEKALPWHLVLLKLLIAFYANILERTLKLRYKAAIIMTLFGVAILLLLSVGYDTYSHKVLQSKDLERMSNISHEVALHVESRLTEKARIASTLASSPIIKNALLKSNSQFALLSDAKTMQEVDRLNKQWKNTDDINDPFIQNRMANPVSEYFKQQTTVIPEEYGEIFRFSLGSCG